MAVEFIPIDNEGRYAIQAYGYPHAFTRMQDGYVKRLVIYNEKMNKMPTAALLRAIADKLEELEKER